jgi:hypothetical protein
MKTGVNMKPTSTQKRVVIYTITTPKVTKQQALKKLKASGLRITGDPFCWGDIRTNHRDLMSSWAKLYPKQIKRWYGKDALTKTR